MTPHHDLDIPAFLRIPQEERKTAWKGRRLRPTREMNFGKPSRVEDPATKRVRKEVEAAERAKAERKAQEKCDARALERRRAALLKEEILMAHSDVGPKQQQLRNLRNQKPVRIVKTTTIAKPAPIIEAQQETDTMSKKPSTAKKPVAKKAAKAAPKPARRAAKAKAPKPAKTARDAAGAKVIRPGSKLEIVHALLTRPAGCTAAEVLKATEWPAVSMPQQARAAGLTLRQEKEGKVTRYWGTAGA